MAMDLPALNALSFPRKLSYDVLSELFAKKPDEILLRKLNTEGLLDFLGKSCECEEIAEKIGIAVRELLLDQVQIKTLAEEFENVFLIPLADSYIPPVASAFLGAARGSGFFGSLPEELLAVYEACGARFGDGPEGTFVFHPDHVASLFNFMSFLIEKEEGSCKPEGPIPFDDIVDAEKKFFARFIQSWIPIFLGEMRQRVSSDFYKQIAAFAENHVLQENRILGVFPLEASPRATG